MLLPLDLELGLLTGVLLVGDNRVLPLLLLFLVCVCLCVLPDVDDTCRVVRSFVRDVRDVRDVRGEVPGSDRLERSLPLVVALRLLLTDRFCCLTGVDGVIRFFDLLPELL